MDTIKKNYVELITFLEANKNKKVSTILDEAKELCQTKVRAKTSIRDEKGKVIAIFCYYHKQWEELKVVPYGLKASSTTGYNTMCKQGVSSWTAMQKRVKLVDATLLTMLENEKIQIADLADVKEGLLVEARIVDETDKPDSYIVEDEKIQIADMADVKEGLLVEARIVDETDKPDSYIVED